ncbi:glycosyltransferase family 2 protein [Colwellia ponticola]|uniref:Glycosyltransferase family 2 protein n=1 Tax=Colwellia ponticola TaxID=2304625 RepID=A0A8H2JKV8_9GAMM|nr:glycosyltransferase family 2 protein [Colwellia ponticola]TMM45270.1 glycosyltransferase family 2 protein [Colwellia ponticola]
MMTDLAISVIIPAYNCQDKIHKALQSVLAQTFKASEIIIVDDGSSDNLEKALIPYKKHIKYIKKNNGGASSARNLGVYHSNSSWVAFLDADDIWHEDKLKVQAHVIESFESTNISIICSEYRFVNAVDQLALNKQSIDFSYEKVNIEKLLNRPYLATPTVIISKHLFNIVGGYNEMLHTAEDLDLYLKLVIVGDVIKVNSELTNCLMSLTSLTSQHDTYDNEIELYHSLNKKVKYEPYSSTINKHIQDCQIDKLKYLLFMRQPQKFHEFYKSIKAEIPVSLKYKLLLKYWLLRLVF